MATVRVADFGGTVAFTVVKERELEVKIMEEDPSIASHLFFFCNFKYPATDWRCRSRSSIMDIHVANLPYGIREAQLRVFLRDELRRFNILAYDIFIPKQKHAKWAMLTVAVAENGQRFLNHFGYHGKATLQFGRTSLKFSKSNRGQFEPSKVAPLLQKEEEMRAKNARNTLASKSDSLKQSSFQFATLETGVWGFDHLHRLMFDQKFEDKRKGSVIFGKTALVLYLDSPAHHETSMHARVDISYTILEHVVLSESNGSRPTVTFTLRSPPRIYQILDDESLHLYAGDIMATPDPLLSFSNLILAEATKSQSGPQLKRLSSLDQNRGKNSALCMVYRVSLQNHNLAQASSVVKHFVKDYVYWSKTTTPTTTTATIEHEYKNLEEALAARRISFHVSYQLLALVHEGTLTPAKTQELIRWVVSRSVDHRSESISLAIARLGQQIQTPEPHAVGTELELVTLWQSLDKNLIDVGQTDLALFGQNHMRQHLVKTLKVTVTPTGIFLRGPDWNISNRVIRKYSSQWEYFMRVTFADEDGQPVSHDSRASQDDVYERFRKILSEGIVIARRRYEFFGWSSSSLRQHQAWFMAPFMYEGRALCARDVIHELGDFSEFRCSAKCAARIGQAFSDTMYAMPIPSNCIVTEEKSDVERNNRCFSDGCGTISLELLRKVWEMLPPRHRQYRPTVLQIRCRGAKGLVSSDPTLPGLQLLIRKSMTKFVAGKGWNDIELCGAAYKPRRMFLNHQVIKILEDAGIPTENFEKAQDKALIVLKLIFEHPLNSISLLESSQSGVHAKIPLLLQFMLHIGISFQKDPFLTSLVKIAAMSTLRDLKYRARIEVTEGCLLYGIMDETNTLREGQVYITTKEEIDGIMIRKTVVKDRVVVTRAPALHPGDIQLVEAVEVPEDCPLRELQNCIVFSQQGARDVPSMLSGGDLDGDEFGIIYDDLLTPRPESIATPADYAPVRPFDLGRPVEIEDMQNFFIQFMQMDRLGQISTKHKIRADFKAHGTHDPDCILLAELASNAVDFSKSGVPADMSKIPRGKDHIRPDFMAPRPTLVMGELGATEIKELEGNDVDDPDYISVLDPDKRPFRYYKSQKANGVLYRNIDEHRFFDQLHKQCTAHHQHPGEESVIAQLTRYMHRETIGIQWAHHTKLARDLMEYYTINMRDIQYSLRPHRDLPLTELDVFTGSILGMKSRASDRHTRTANQEVRERFNRDVHAMVRLMVHGGDAGWHGDDDDDDDDDGEALPRAIACWNVALKGLAQEKKGREGESWKYVCAAVCLDELMKYYDGTLRPL